MVRYKIALLLSLSLILGCSNSTAPPVVSKTASQTVYGGTWHSGYYNSRGDNVNICPQLSLCRFACKRVLPSCVLTGSFNSAITYDSESERSGHRKTEKNDIEQIISVLMLLFLSYPFGILGGILLFTPFIPFKKDGPKPFKVRVYGGILCLIALYLLWCALPFPERGGITTWPFNDLIRGLSNEKQDEQRDEVEVSIWINKTAFIKNGRKSC